MAARQSTPTCDYSHSDVHKRVYKACDRCRLKKSKCDGASPCSRCGVDNTICAFRERKKAYDKMYPKGCSNSNQPCWCTALRNSTAAQSKAIGNSLEPELNGHSLTHDLVMPLGALDHNTGERFEENPEAIQQQLWRYDLQLQESSFGNS